MKEKCDVCGTTKDVRCEVMLKGEDIDRIYHLCPKHWVEVFRKCLDDFLEQNEYKANSYIKSVADKLIVDNMNRKKMMAEADSEGMIDIAALQPDMVRVLRSYKDDVEDGDVNG